MTEQKRLVIALAGEKASMAETIQLALLFACNLLTLVFTKGERKGAANKIEALIHENEMETGFHEIINQIISVATRSLT